MVWGTNKCTGGRDWKCRKVKKEKEGAGGTSEEKIISFLIGADYIS